MTENGDGQGHVNQHLRVADRMATMGRLAAGVAHEINNPLTYVMTSLAELQQCAGGLGRLRQALDRRLGPDGAAEVLAEAGVERAMDGELAQLIAEALEGAGRVQQCVADLRTFSLVEEDAEQAPLQVSEVLDGVLKVAHNEIRYRARVTRDYGRTLAVKASPGRLSHVFLNLVLNAAQAIDEGRVDENELSARTYMDGGEVVVEVRDTGCGVPAEDLPRLFDPFFSTRPVGEGTGMGLAICHSVVRALGGSVTLESEPGQGTCATVRLPAVRPEYRRVQPTPSPGEPLRGGRILVVDDEANIRRALTRLLGQAGYEVVDVDSGDGARELLEQDAGFDVVLCDLMMERGSGMDLYGWLEEGRPELARRTLFLSGGGVTARARRFLDRMKERAFAKPLDIQGLLARINHEIAEREGEVSR